MTGLCCMDDNQCVISSDRTVGTVGTVPTVFKDFYKVPTVLGSYGFGRPKP